MRGGEGRGEERGGGGRGERGREGGTEVRGGEVRWREVRWREGRGIPLSPERGDGETVPRGTHCNMAAPLEASLDQVSSSPQKTV